MAEDIGRVLFACLWTETEFHSFQTSYKKFVGALKQDLARYISFQSNK